MVCRSALITIILLAGNAYVDADDAENAPQYSSDLSVSPDRFRPMTDYFRVQVEQKRIAGAVAAISVDGQIEYLQATGHQGLETEVPMRADTLFRIASMTKPVTSAAVMALMEDGLLMPDDPISDYLPGFSETRVLRSIRGDSVETVAAQRVPTIRDLLTHQSGLTYGWFGPEKLDAIYRRHRIPRLFEPVDETMADRVSRIQQVPLKFQPGTAWDYGVSTDVLGHVVEVVSGKSLAAFFEDRFFQPLRMRDTFFHVPAEKRHRLAGLFTVDQQQNLKAVNETPVQAGFLRFTGNFCTEPGSFYSGGGGLVSTAADYLRFLQMLLNGGQLDGVRVLSQQSVAQMTQNQIGELTLPIHGHGDSFGFGFGVVTERGKDQNEFSVGTYSWGGIFNTYFWVDPQRQLIAVMMTQLFPNDHLKMRDAFRRLVYAAVTRGPCSPGRLRRTQSLKQMQWLATR